MSKAYRLTVVIGTIQTSRLLSSPLVLLLVLLSIWLAWEPRPLPPQQDLRPLRLHLRGYKTLETVSSTMGLALDRDQLSKQSWVILMRRTRSHGQSLLLEEVEDEVEEEVEDDNEEAGEDIAVVAVGSL